MVQDSSSCKQNEHNEGKEEKKKCKEWKQYDERKWLYKLLSYKTIQ